MLLQQRLDFLGEVNNGGLFRERGGCRSNDQKQRAKYDRAEAGTRHVGSLFVSGEAIRSEQINERFIVDNQSCQHNGSADLGQLPRGLRLAERKSPV
jgi:hypothetical protein